MFFWLTVCATLTLTQATALARTAVFLGVRSTAKVGVVEKDLEKDFREQLKEDIQWLSEGAYRNFLKQKKLEDALNWIELFKPRQWQIFLDQLGVGDAFYVDILNEVEIETKSRAEVFLEVRVVRAGKDFTDLLSSEKKAIIKEAEGKGYAQAEGREKLKKARKEAVNIAVKESLAKLFGKEVSTKAFPVVANRSSRLFHLPDANHLPESHLQIRFSSIEEAEKAGFKPCPIDFPALLASTENLSQLENLLGQESAGEVERRYRVLQSEKLLQRVEQVASRLPPYAGRPGLRFIFRLLDTDMINAFATPGGVIYITRGMLDILESEDELAAVLAHELSHVVRKHGLSQFKRYRDLALLGTLGNILTEGKLSLIIDFAQLLVLNGYDRRYEREADQDALLLLLKLHIDPEAFLRVLNKLRDLEGTDPSRLEVYFRTHPSTKERLKRAKELLNKKKAFFAHLEQLSEKKKGGPGG